MKRRDKEEQEQEEEEEEGGREEKRRTEVSRETQGHMNASQVPSTPGGRKTRRETDEKKRGRGCCSRVAMVAPARAMEASMTRPRSNDGTTSRITSNETWSELKTREQYQNGRDEMKSERQRRQQQQQKGSIQQALKGTARDTHASRVRCLCHHTLPTLPIYTYIIREPGQASSGMTKVRTSHVRQGMTRHDMVRQETQKTGVDEKKQ